MTKAQWNQFVKTGTMEDGCNHWFAAPEYTDLAVRGLWIGDSIDHHRRDAGLIRRTKREAQALSKQMLAVAKEKETK